MRHRQWTIPKKPFACSWMLIHPSSFILSCHNISEAIQYSETHRSAKKKSAHLLYSICSPDLLFKTEMLNSLVNAGGPCKNKYSASLWFENAWEKDIFSVFLLWQKYLVVSAQFCYEQRDFKFFSNFLCCAGEHASIIYALFCAANINTKCFRESCKFCYYGVTNIERNQKVWQ